MSRIAYVDGQYVGHADAAVHIEDRGYQFADAVYEVYAVAAGALLDSGPHFARLRRSLDAVAIDFSMSDKALASILGETLRRNRIRNGIVYVQISRGQARRDHAYPDAAKPVLVVTARRMSFAAIEARARQGVGVITVPDIRWRRCDIKSVSLLPNIMAKQKAREAGAYEAWFVDGEGCVTEGTSTNAWIVDRDGNLATRYLDTAILSGVTRGVVHELAERNAIQATERVFTLDEAKGAREAFLTSTTSFILPVTRIDGDPVADGRPGPVSLALLELYKERLEFMS